MRQKAPKSGKVGHQEEYGAKEDSKHAFTVFGGEVFA